MHARSVRGVAVIALVIALGALAAVAATGTPAGADAASAWGAGFKDWWRSHAKEVAQFAGCVVDGLAAARFMALGGAAGGLLSAVAVAAAAIGCMD
jgi:hypothetical protein